MQKEGWVKFTRVHCKEGFMDVWTGDALHNPNDKTENRWCINSFTVYLRLNGKGQWIESNTKSVRKHIEDCKERLSAEEIFKKLTENDNNNFK